MFNYLDKIVNYLIKICKILNSFKFKFKFKYFCIILMMFLILIFRLMYYKLLFIVFFNYVN